MYGLILVIIAVAFIAIASNMISLKRMSEGNTEMVNLAKTIRDGAAVFMSEEYKYIIPTVVIVALLLSCFIEKTSGATFALGALMSSLACVIGMRSATYANVRTTNTAYKFKSIGATTKTALLGGSISGLSVPAFGMFGLILVCMANTKLSPDTSTGFIRLLSCNPATMRLTTYSLGCSLVAMFNRIAGGNYTKAADIAADNVAKIKYDLPEDDSRNPATVADQIGDNVNDVGGNVSDLLESFVATLIACLLLAGANTGLGMFPWMLAGSGLLASIASIMLTLWHNSSDNPESELNYATYVAAAVSAAMGVAASFLIFGGEATLIPDGFRFGWISPAISSILGIISGVAIGKITEYYTGTNYKPVQQLAKMAVRGEAYTVTKGDAIGSRSCFPAIGVLCVALVASGLSCGIYGIAVSALGMMSFIGVTVAIDAFGPIADNAGGIAEGCHLPEDVREITDRLDAVGNTTAAIGKGFAIGSAAFATVSLMFTYVKAYSDGEPVLNVAGYIVIAGVIFGAAFVEYFIACLTDNTLSSADLMTDECVAQLENPDIMNGTMKPDYSRCISIAANEALKKMLKPALMSLLLPTVGGLLFGVEFVGGIMIGATITAIPRAIFMSTSGGAFDNAKKLIESGWLSGYGKGSEPHKIAVAADTIGDTRKDVNAVSLDIAAKLIATTSNTLLPLFRMFHLF